MYYINENPNVSGNYGNPVGQPFTGCLKLPEALLSSYIEAKGFILPEVVDGEVVGFTWNQEALDAYLAEHPEVPETEPEATTEELLNILLGVSE